MAKNDKKVEPAKKVRPPEETETFTTTKKRVGLQWLATVFAYVDGRRTGIERAGVHIQLDRMQEFKPAAFCASFTGAGWKEGELLGRLDELLEFLNEKATNRARPEVIHWEDRPRSFNEKQLESVIDRQNETILDNEEKIGQLEALFQEALKNDPALAELRKKVMAE